MPEVPRIDLGRISAPHVGPDDEYAWCAEAHAITLSDDDFDVADATHWPDEIQYQADAAEEDANLETEVDHWMEWLLEAEPYVWLGIEQSCDSGLLLPWDMRAVRLAAMPSDGLQRLHLFWRHCPAHVCAYLSLYFYWLVRAERGHRRQTASWSTRSPLPPEPVELPPRKLTIRRGYL